MDVRRSYLKMKLSILLSLFVCLFIMPSLIFLYGFYRNNFAPAYLEAGLDYDTGFTGFEGLEQLEFDKSGEIFCDNGLYLGAIDAYQDCNLKCDSGDYEYKFIKSSQNVVINRKKLVGAYCLPKAVTKCNLNTSMAVIGLDGYKCLSYYPTILGGESGNEILACNGKIVDRLNKKTYEKFIPNNLSLTSFDEKFEGEYRFKCDTDGRMELPSSIATRLETEVNTCGLLDRDGKFDFSNLKCQCDTYVYGDDENICSKCSSGFARATDAHGWRYGYTLARDCVDPTSAEYVLTSFIKLPCGEKSLSEGRYCQRALLNATNTYTPMALENIFK